MERVSAGGWEVECDVAATRAAHAAVAAGGSEACGCAHCRNFAAARGQVYPPAFLALLGRLGVDPTREAEVYHNGPAADGRHLYAGWFHAVGTVVRDPLAAGDPGAGITHLGPDFRFYLAAGGSLVPPAFGDRPVVQVEFEATAPWVLAEPAG